MALICNCCQHPLVSEGQECPFCRVKDATKTCPTCTATMMKMPFSLEPGGYQYICQHCALQDVIPNT